MKDEWETQTPGGAKVVFGRKSSLKLAQHVEANLFSNQKGEKGGKEEEGEGERDQKKKGLLICSSSERGKREGGELVKGLNEHGSFVVELYPHAIMHVPHSLVQKSLEFCAQFQPDFLVSYGGGSSLGLAKGIASNLGVPIVSLPTNYSGSEQTNIYGITTKEGGKQGGRDDRVRPKLVIYDVNLTLSLPFEASVKSAMNGLAHAVDALWFDSPVVSLLAEEGIRSIVGGLKEFKRDHLDDIQVRTKLLYGAYLCSVSLDQAPMALHHKLAHILGGTFNLDHSAVHSVLLPFSLAYNNCAETVDAFAKLNRALHDPSSSSSISSDPAELIFELQRELGVPTSLREVGFSLEGVEKVVEKAMGQQYSNPCPLDPKKLNLLLRDAFHGRRPSQKTRRSQLSDIPNGKRETDWERGKLDGYHSEERVSICGASLEEAEAIVVCIHGKYASSDRILQQFERSVGPSSLYPSKKVSILAPQAVGSAWYPNSFLKPREENEPGVSSALSVIDYCVRLAATYVHPQKIVLMGFSQGACLSISYVCSKGSLVVGSVAALSGSLLGSDEEVNENTYPCHFLHSSKVFFGCAEEDAYIPLKRIDQATSLLESKGILVQKHIFPGSSHSIIPAEDTVLRLFLNHALNATVTSDSKLERGLLPSQSKIGTGVPSGMKNDPYFYLGGYRTVHQSEALPGTIPPTQLMPRDISYGLIYEQINGTPFCAPRATNAMTSFYRIHPSIGSHHEFNPLPHPTFTGIFSLPLAQGLTPEPLRWNPSILPDEEEAKDFVDSIVTLAGSGDPMAMKGLAIHTFACNKDMKDRSFYNSDGDMLIVPELAALNVQTEFGYLHVSPGEVLVVPKGLKMSVTLPAGPSRGWIAEVFEGHGGFQLPNLGPIGSHGLADPRHFLVPTAAYEDRKVDDYQLISKFGGKLFAAKLEYSPYDVVGWSGRYHPCKYNLMNFKAFGSVTWDHGDPSIHTVLNWPFDDKTSASACDFVCFRGRWDSVDHTFRPPFYHRNAATEFNAIIKIDQPYSGFDQGVHWLTPLHTAHGISAASCEKFRNLPSDKGEGPMKLSDDAIWIMFESSYPLTLTPIAAALQNRDVNYRREFFWGVKRLFNGPSQGSASQS